MSVGADDGNRSAGSTYMIDTRTRVPESLNLTVSARKRICRRGCIPADSALAITTRASARRGRFLNRKVTKRFLTRIEATRGLGRGSDTAIGAGISVPSRRSAPLEDDAS